MGTEDFLEEVRSITKKVKSMQLIVKKNIQSISFRNTILREEKHPIVNYWEKETNNG